MTCIAAIIDNKGVGHIACDSLGSDLLSKRVFTTPKIFVVGDMLIGFTGSYRIGQLLQYRLQLPTARMGQELDEWLHVDFIDSVREILLQNGAMQVDNSVELADSKFLVVVAGRVFTIQEDLSLLESVDPFEAVGSGEMYARATMNALVQHKVTKPERVLTEAIEAAAKYVPSVGGDIHLLSEGDSEYA